MRRPYHKDVQSSAPVGRRARELRREASLPERLLWNALKSARTSEPRVRRQHPLGPFVADFYCHAAGLAVEVDGASHAGARKGQDDARDAWMRARRIEVVRVAAREVLRDPDAVAAFVLKRVRERVAELEGGGS